jgi:hypothetical protein
MLYIVVFAVFLSVFAQFESLEKSESVQHQSIVANKVSSYKEREEGTTRCFLFGKTITSCSVITGSKLLTIDDGTSTHKKACCEKY